MNVTMIPESAPFNVEQRAWLNGFFAGMMGFNGENSGNGPTALAEPPDQEEEEFPWHDSALSMEERLEMAEGKPLERRLMAAMAQLDCGACGHHCQTYAEAIVSGEEKSLTRCAPGGKETSRMLKLLMKDAPVNGSTNGATKVAPSGPTRDNPVRCLPSHSAI